jgi:hypothetical protein
MIFFFEEIRLTAFTERVIDSSCKFLARCECEEKAAEDVCGARMR